MASQSYGVATASRITAPLRFFEQLLLPSALATSANIKGFKFCVTKMKLDGEGDVAITKDGASELDAKLGLVDLGDGSAEVSWGNLDIPSGSVIKRIKIEIHQDADLCGVAYSAAISDVGGQEFTISKDIELKFLLSSPKTLAAGDSVTVSLSNLVAQFDSALQANQFTDEAVGQYLETYAAGSDDSAE